MAENTNIAWATHSWNPWLGCCPVHTGCRNCYAEAWAKQYHAPWGPGGPYRSAAGAFSRD